jgi:osmoprotectant transport system permease protein
MVWLWNNLGLISGLALDHARWSVIPILVGFAASIPLGWLSSRYRVARSIILSGASILFTIPSLALFVTLPAIIHTQILDPINVVVALSVYAISMMARGAADAFDAVAEDVVSSARAVGFNARQSFWTVELPLAGPVLVASLRVVSVSTISILSVAAIIGRGGLGYLFVDGYQRYFPTEILVGIGAILLLALIFDGIIVSVGRLVMPWTRAPKRASSTPALVTVPGPRPEANGGAS